jgi:hypothetical protein
MGMFPVQPGHPIQVPFNRRINGVKAVTSPPGLGVTVQVPLSSAISTGSRLDTISNSLFDLEGIVLSNRSIHVGINPVIKKIN